MNMHELLLKANGVYAIYKGKEGANNIVALKGINLEIKKGEFLSVVGPSGSGKSSLLRILGGLQRPSAGKIEFYGRDITKLSEDDLVPIRRDTVGFVFQSPNLINSFTALENVTNTLRYAGYSYNKSKKRAAEVLDQLGMRSRMNDYPSKLSGGERQRVGIARAIANNPKLILADEPSGNLDHENTENLMGLFSDLHKELNTAFFLVTHSNYVSKFANRTLEILDGSFTGEHGENVNLQNLDETREVIINQDGTLTLPPQFIDEIIKQGNKWKFNLDHSSGIVEIRGKPISTDPKLFKEYNCPLCGEIVNSNMFNCKKCGVQLD